MYRVCFFFFQAEDGIRDLTVTGVQTCALPISNVRVLVVDNNAQAAESVAVLLGIWGYQVRVAYDGPAALREVPGWQPDVILLDIGMPGMDGYEVAQQLRARKATKTPILMAVTGYAQDEDRQRAEEAGFDYH